MTPRLRLSEELDGRKLKKVLRTRLSNYVDINTDIDEAGITEWNSGWMQGRGGSPEPCL
jgi:hypothetical protein